MQEAGVISDYLESIADALSFDRSLSRRVRQEVEDHFVGGRCRRSDRRSPRGAAARDRQFRRFACHRCPVRHRLAREAHAQGWRRRNSRHRRRFRKHEGPRRMVCGNAVGRERRHAASQRNRGLDRSLRILAFGSSRDRRLGVHRRPTCSRRLQSETSPAASSCFSPVRVGDGAACRLGDQRWRAHGVSIVCGGSVRRFHNSHLLDGD
jgi:hypothetical protein